MALEEYSRKRDFEKTQEPRGNTKTRQSGNDFVIQKHAARRLHYDFRLQLDGVLKSWAVPKGPSLDPTVKSLAVHVEDHPLEYADFEGIIPQKQYGGGTVMVWDRGSWLPIGDAAKSYRQGKLKFTLKGEKLAGEWTLVRMSGRAGEDGKNWLLRKSNDEAARRDDEYQLLERAPRSVLSGRNLEEIRSNADRVWNGQETSAEKQAPATIVDRRSDAVTGQTELQAADLPHARAASLPSDFSPQLATLATSAPRGERWLHELKLDGYRILAFVSGGTVRLVTRNGKDWTKKFSNVAEAFRKLDIADAVFDGEVVALDRNGGTDFQRLQNHLRHGKKASLIYYCFDLPFCNGYDLSKTPLIERKRLLEQTLLAVNSDNSGTLRYSDHIRGDGRSVVEQACRLAMEGVISKRADSPYSQARTRHWLKIKCLRRQEFVIGGYTPPSGSRVGFGALLLGYYDQDRLIYCGRVGTGFTTDSLKQIKDQLRQLESDHSPFWHHPSSGAQAKGVTWVAPRLVGEVEFSQWTNDGMLRHPSFQGIREDKPPRAVVREMPAAGESAGEEQKQATTSAQKPAHRSRSPHPAPQDEHGSTEQMSSSPSSNNVVAGIRLSHPERILFPSQGMTKLDLAEYYEKVADWVLPHIVDRPLSLVRCPKGRAEKCFYQKHLTGSLPKELRTVSIREKNKQADYPVISNLGGLISLVQMGVLEIHPWPSRIDRIERPDRLVFDLDPGEGTEWNDIVRAARQVHDRLADLSLESYVRTSGGKGLHVVVPVDRRTEWNDLKGFAKAFADQMVAQQPDRYTATMSKSKRRGKLFIDYLRNQRGATTVASYSTRARMNAPVATPLRWDELGSLKDAAAYTTANLPFRLSHLADDPWNGFFSIRQSLTKSMMKDLKAA